MTKIGIIGSVAAGKENPTDLDIVGSYTDIIDYVNWYSQSVGGQILSQYTISKAKTLITVISTSSGLKIVEGSITWSDSTNKELFELIVSTGSVTVLTDKILTYTAPLDLLYTLKMSHRYKRNSPHFLKTMVHIHEMRKLGASIRPEYESFYISRMKETYNYPHPKLNVQKDKFFDDTVEYVYDHDSIHEAVKLGDRPAYMEYSVGQVMTSEELFNKVPLQTRLNGVAEEAFVLSLERSILPYDSSPYNAYKTALKKICTSITSGYFREFAWENYDAVLNMYRDDLLQVFYKKLSQGVVKLHKSVL